MSALAVLSMLLWVGQVLREAPVGVMDLFGTCRKQMSTNLLNVGLIGLR